MNIGILGGSFDPPHKSHKVIADECIKRKLVDEVWVCPTFNHVDKKNSATFEQRFKMCKMMFGGFINRKIKVKDCEQYNSSGTTIELIALLKINFPDHNFKVIIGEDRAEHIEEWKWWKQLTDGTDFIIFKREDYVGGFHPEKSEWFTNSDRHIVIKCEECWISSTYCRRISKQRCFNILDRILTNKKIAKYIEKQNIYQRR